jgi:hypothetical protein
MSLINLSVKHGKTLEEARTRLELTVNEVRARFGALVQRVDWAADRNTVILAGTGFLIEIRVDAQDLHLTGDLPILGAIFGNAFASGLKQIIGKTFQKSLP